MLDNQFSLFSLKLKYVNDILLFANYCKLFCVSLLLRHILVNMHCLLATGRKSIRTVNICQLSSKKLVEKYNFEGPAELMSTWKITTI